MAVKTRKQERFSALLRNIVSSFIMKEIGLGVLVTVTRVESADDLRQAKVFVSVFPEIREKEILDLLKKKMPEFYEHLKSQLKIKFLPQISFAADRGMKMEREIEEALKS